MEKRTRLYHVYCSPGKEETTAAKIMKAVSRTCRRFAFAAATPFMGYVQLEVETGENDRVRYSTTDIPEDVRAAVEVVRGVKIVGNGREAVPMDEK